MDPGGQVSPSHTNDRKLQVKNKCKKLINRSDGLFNTNNVYYSVSPQAPGPSLVDSGHRSLEEVVLSIRKRERPSSKYYNNKYVQNKLNKVNGQKKIKQITNILAAGTEANSQPSRLIGTRLEHRSLFVSLHG